MIVFTLYFWLNIVAFVLFGLDKFQAVRHGWRLPEALLLVLSVLGGATGALLAMLFFWHKVRKPLFLILVPLFAIAHTVGYWYYFFAWA